MHKPASSAELSLKGKNMFSFIAIVIGICLAACAAVVALPVLIVLAAVGLILFCIVAGSGFLALFLVGLVIIVPLVIVLHLFIPLLVPILLICGIVYLVQHFKKSHA
jgi:hypothetical protein